MRGICKRFGPTVALDRVDFDVRAGEVHALLGENGAGKSTLMGVLAGAIAMDTGAIELDGRPFAPGHPAAARTAGVAHIHQELALAPHLSVAANVMLGIEPVHDGTLGRLGILDRSELRRRAAAALARVGRADLPLDAPVARLGIAERQLVEIARSVAIGARVVVFDEPTSSLTRAGVAHLFELTKALRADGVAIVWISHFLEELRAIADRCTVLRDGANAGTFALSDVRDDELVARMVGREIEALHARSARQRGEVLLEVDGLTLHRGEVLGIAGLVGAGRTELVRAIFGLDPVRSGRVRVRAHGGPRSPRASWRDGVGFVSEDRKGEGLALARTIAENVALPKLPSWPTAPALAAATSASIETLGVRCTGPAQRVRELSGGNQQKVALARLLFADCDVWLLDEPTRGIDVAARAEVHRLIDGLAAGSSGDRPRGVLLVSSQLPELLAVCDRIAVMRAGRLGPARDVRDLDEHALLEEALP
ncbi:MAG: sugar ABC transporter ATP-binding protein [Planctomycetes bacterium]|nr:sugar ABC transporter ATP-binding protein [Planctomycetota bacterium]